MDYVLIKNKVKCKHCGDIIESKYHHDFVTCSCGKVSIDGGLQYFRLLCDNPKEDIEDLREWIKK